MESLNVLSDTNILNAINAINALKQLKTNVKTNSRMIFVCDASIQNKHTYILNDVDRHSEIIIRSWDERQRKKS